MATPSEVQELIDDARCYTCFSGMEWYVVMAALIDVRDGNPVPTDANELIAEATCLQCISAGMVPAIIVNLLRGISSGGGVGSCNSVGSGSPEGVVTANPGCTYLNTDADAFWIKKSGVGNVGWLPLIV